MGQPAAKLARAIFPATLFRPEVGRGAGGRWPAGLRSRDVAAGVRPPRLAGKFYFAEKAGTRAQPAAPARMPPDCALRLAAGVRGRSRPGGARSELLSHRR